MGASNLSELAEREVHGRLLIVDEDGAVLRQQSRALLALGFAQVARAHRWDDASNALAHGCDVLLVEACFRDGSDCRALLRSAMHLPNPPIVIATSDRACRALIAELAFSGADAYIERPVEALELVGRLTQARDDVHRCRRAALRLVGRVGLKEAQWYLRGLMNREALARAGGSRRGAAEILQVDRRYVARLAREFRSATFASALEHG